MSGGIRVSSHDYTKRVAGARTSNGLSLSPIQRSMKTLDQLTPDDASRSGGKAWNCARLKQAGFPVPDGIVVPTTASQADLATLDRHPWFDTLPAGTTFAVRSSGVDEDAGGQSFAGIHETRLNVPRAGIHEAAEASRASVRSPQALAYRRAMGLPEGDAKTAVLIQRMIQPVAAGVGFTINPVTGADDEIVVNSSWGLGEALVSGLIDPDEFRVRKRDLALLMSRAGIPGEPTHERPVSSEFSADLPDGRHGEGARLSLSPAQLHDLAVLLVAIERHYGSPQDVEWCYDGAQFWAVQSRPIAAKGAVKSGIEWTRANLAEVLPDLTSPQALAAFDEMLNQGQRKYMRGLTAPEDVLGPMFKSFNGRLYFNLSQLRHVSAIGGTPPASMMRSLGHSGEIRPEDEKPIPVALSRRLKAVPSLLRIMARHLRAERLLHDHDAKVAAFHARVASADPAALSDERLWAVILEWRRGAPDMIQMVLTFGGVLIFEEQLRSICGKVGVPIEEFLFPQLAAGERSVSAQQAFDLTALAATARAEPAVRAQLLSDPLDVAALRVTLQGTAFASAFERFLEIYGHRGLYESDWALPRYSEDPTPLFRAIRAHLDESPHAGGWSATPRQSPDAAQAWSDFERRLTPWQRWTLLPQARWLVKRIKQYYVWREHCRYEMIRTLSVLRRWHLVLAHRFAERGWIADPQHYFLLEIDEVGRIVQHGPAALDIAALVKRRTAELERNRRITMPLLMREAELPDLIRRAGVSSEDDGGDLRGVTTSPGRVEGEVAVILDPGHFASMKRGAILVARATDPSWTPLFTLASGVIVEVGGILSHASTVAREYGLPALANVQNATKRLRTGERVVLDATRGFVRKLTLLLMLLSTNAIAAQDWPEFRGPTGQGHSTERGLPLEWSESRNVLWKTPVPGSGWSSPVVAGGRVWLTSAVEDDGISLRALAFDIQTGREVVNVEVFRLRSSPLLNAKNTRASPTPIVEGDRVYVHFGTDGTAALTTAGAIVWTARFAYASQHGNGGSPIVYGDLLIFSCDGSDDAFVVALDKRTGKVRWRTGRRQPFDQAYSTPLVIRIGDRDQVVSVGAYRAGAYDPNTGREIWRVSYADGFSNVPRPVFGHGLVYLATGFQEPSLLAVRADGRGDVTRTHVAWTVRRSAPLTPSPLLVGGEIYLVNDVGIASCLDAKTGEPHWRQRLNGNYSASPVFADGRIYFLSEEGVATVIEPGTTFRVVATNTLDGATLASMAVSDGSILIRSDRHLYRLGVR
jgi:outer membrane protein assembly factor BamB